jgi:acetyl-CoA acyltransferase
VEVPAGSVVTDVAVVGVGIHPFGQFPDRNLWMLAREAIWAAIHDAEIDPRQIDVAYVANCYSGFFTGQHDAIAPIVIGRAGLSGFPMIHVKGGGASGSVAFHEAVIAVKSGLYRMALVVGVEKLYVPGNPAISITAINSSGELNVGTELGLTYMADFSMSTQRLMNKYGWSPTDFALIAEKSRANAMLNPNAQVHEPMSVEEILNARVVAFPLTRPMCCAAAVDGAAAVLVCDAELAEGAGSGSHPKVAGIGYVSGQYISNRVEDPRPGMLALNESSRAFALAYERAAVGPEDLELVQVHDSVAPEELLSYQVLGLCAPGEESSFLRSGATRIDGRVPVNSDGGLLSRGHPIAASGVAQVVETVIQMRGQAGDRQVLTKDSRPPRLAAIQNAGAQGGPSGGVGVSAAIILKS